MDLSVKDKKATRRLKAGIVGQLRAGLGWQMAVNSDKQLGDVNLAKIHVVLHPPVTDLMLDWLPNISCHH